LTRVQLSAFGARRMLKLTRFGLFLRWWLCF